MAPWLFLFTAVVFAAFTYNAYRPIRRVPALLVPSFLAGWLMSELPWHQLALHALAVAYFVAAGAHTAPAGWAALALLGVSAFFVFGFIAPARLAREILERALCEGLNAEPGPQVSLDAARGSLLHMTLPFLRVHPDVKQHLDVRYAEGAGPRHLCDVYAPKHGAQRAPVVLQIHGGGWFTGHKRQQAVPMLLHLASRGFVCVAINYRLSPRATWPEHLIDCKLAIKFIREHIAEYGGDPDYITVTGGSAGGHLAAMVALTPNDPSYQPGFEHVDTRVRAAVPFYAVYDLTDRHATQVNAGLKILAARVVLKKRPRKDPQAFLAASPMTHIGPHAPPMFVIQGMTDNLVSVEDARIFTRLLREQSREPVVYAELPGAHHAFEILHSTRTTYVAWAVASFLEWVATRDRGAPVLESPPSP